MAARVPRNGSGEVLFDVKQTRGVNGGVVNFDKEWRGRRGREKNIPWGSLASLLRVTDPNERLQSLSPPFSNISSRNETFSPRSTIILIRAHGHTFQPNLSFSSSTLMRNKDYLERDFF